MRARVLTESKSRKGAGRLTSATDTPSGVSRAYGFDANSNRCANATTCGSPTFSYNPGDQLTSSPYGSGYVYDTYGNLDTYVKTGGGSVNLDYDSFDHTIRIDDSTTRVDSVLSPDGRVLRRTVSSPPGVTITEDRWYGYTDSSGSPAWSQATSGGAYTTYLSNLVVTGTTPSYQLSDPKGTVVGTVTQAGAFTAMPVPDEYGNIATVPASRLDWLGTQRRFVDHPGLDIVRMGVRAYDPHLGRFLSQDPIAGGSANDYDYVNGDPINGTDLGGTCGVWGNPWKKCRGKRRGSTTSACFTFSGYLVFGGKSALCYRFRDGAPGRGRVGGAVGAGMGTLSLGAGVSIGRSNARTAAEVRGVSGYGGGGIGPVGAECAGGSSDLRPGRGRFIGDCAATLGRNWFPWPEGHVGIQLSG